MKDRRAQLTDEGKKLLAEAGPLLAGFRTLEQNAAWLAAAGRQNQVKLSVDSLYPNERLAVALAEMAHSYPYVYLHLHKSTFISSVHEFAAFGADACITVFPDREHFIKPILDVRMRAAAKAGHPLHAGTCELTHADLVRHLAVAIEGTAGPQRKRQPYSKLQRLWAVDTIESAIEAVRGGMCFGWLPVYRIQPYLNSGELVSLRLPLDGERTTRMFLVLKEANSSGHPQSALADFWGGNCALEVV